jgi:hypothetical protein
MEMQPERAIQAEPEQTEMQALMELDELLAAQAIQE